MTQLDPIALEAALDTKLDGGPALLRDLFSLNANGSAELLITAYLNALAPAGKDEVEALNGREVLFFASYCAGDDPSCTPVKPCPTCLGMSNVYRITGRAEYVRELAPEWNVETPALRRPIEEPKPGVREAALEEAAKVVEQWSARIRSTSAWADPVDELSGLATAIRSLIGSQPAEGGGRMPRHAATYTFDQKAWEDGAGALYYFAPADAAPGPYLEQRHVNAIIDIDRHGRLGGVELIDNMPLPPLTPEDTSHG